MFDNIYIKSITYTQNINLKRKEKNQVNSSEHLKPSLIIKPATYKILALSSIKNIKSK
jgi:hypothetical protein